MRKRVSATEAARKFSELLNRVRYKGESFDVVRGGEVVATLTTAGPRQRATVDALIEVLHSVGEPDPSFGDDLERIQDEQPALAEGAWES